MTNNKLKDEILKEAIGEIAYSLYGDSLKKQIFEAMESYHRQRVERITDEMIENKYPTHPYEGALLSELSRNAFKQDGAKWLKEKLLSND